MGSTGTVAGNTMLPHTNTNQPTHPVSWEEPPGTLQANDFG